MSLEEAYSLAHTAQCRLQLAASRPDRDLRFVVGHLMHYESLRLRIVEIEHDISQSQRSRTIQFQSTAPVNNHSLQRRPSTGQLGRKSPPPPIEPNEHIENIDDEDLGDDEDLSGHLYDDDEEGLGLQRFPSSSSSSRSPPSPPDLEPDDYDDSDEYDDDEPVSPITPDEPDQATLEQALTGKEDDVMATMYEDVRKCRCNGKADAPQVERMWDFPASDREGLGLAAGLKKRAVAQVA